MTKIRFIYKGSHKCSDAYERLVEKIILLVKELYQLPHDMEIQFENMGPSVYGMTMLDSRFPNRIRLNQDLSMEEIVIPLTHELIHLHQIFVNKLQSRTGGRILWENQLYKVDTLKLSYEEYQNLPWELDARQQQEKVLKFLQSNRKKLRP